MCADELHSLPVWFNTTFKVFLEPNVIIYGIFFILFFFNSYISEQHNIWEQSNHHSVKLKNMWKLYFLLVCPGYRVDGTHLR